MQEITPELLSAVKYEQYIEDDSGNRNYGRRPYVELIFYNKEGYYWNYTDRFMGLELRLFEDNYTGTIFLRNDDDELVDLDGCWIEPVIGDYFFDEDGNTTGYEGYAKPTLWVKNHRNLSSPRAKYVVLSLEGAREMLKEQTVMTSTTAPQHYSIILDATPIYIIRAFLQEAGMYFDYDNSQFDDVIESLTMDFEINKHFLSKIWDSQNGVERVIFEPNYETFNGVISRAMALNKCHLMPVPRHSLSDKPRFVTVYPPTIAGDREPDEEYFSYKHPFFYEFTYQRKPVIPNHVLVYGGVDPDTGLFYTVYVGEARDEEAIAQYGLVSETNTDGAIRRVFVEGNLRSDADCQSVAEVLLGNFQVASRGGRVITPYDPRVELFDYVRVEDDR